MRSGPKIGICTDSSSQLPRALRDRYDIEVVPLTVSVNGHEYLEDVDLDADEFWAQFAGGRRPDVSTAEPSPGQFALAYESLIERGATEILSVHVAESRAARDNGRARIHRSGLCAMSAWLRGTDSNRRPSGYEPDELPLLHPAAANGSGGPRFGQTSVKRESAPSKDRAQRQERDDRDQLAAQDHPIQVQRGLPLGIAVSNDEDAGRLRGDAEPGSPVALGVAAATSTAAHLGRGEEDRPVLLDRLTEHDACLHRIQGLLHGLAHHRHRFVSCIGLD